MEGDGKGGHGARGKAKRVDRRGVEIRGSAPLF